MCKNNLYRTNRHSCYLLEYHLVVVTKYRHPVLKGAIKVYLLDQTKTIFDSWHCTIKAVNTDLDHIHILFEAPPQVQLFKLANNYKTVTSRLIRKTLVSNSNSIIGSHIFGAIVTLCVAFRTEQNRL